MRGLNVGGVRLPLVPLNNEEKIALQIALQPSNVEVV